MLELYIVTAVLDFEHSIYTGMVRTTQQNWASI